MNEPTRTLPIGTLVVLPAEPQLGVGRVERVVSDDEVRVLLYDSGAFVVRPWALLARCPPGSWDRTRPPPSQPN
jgi:hypothetical protein